MGYIWLVNYYQNYDRDFYVSFIWDTNYNIYWDSSRDFY